MERDSRSLDTVSKEDLALIKSKKVCVIGSGGLGGYVIEMLARFGVGTIKILDGDVFDITNLNRQLLSTEANLGQKKVDEAIKRIHKVNSEVNIIGINEQLKDENAIEYLTGMDVIIDCVDNIKTRFVLQKYCKKLKIPMIHGAVGSWNGQVITIFPEDNILQKIFGDESSHIKPIGAASFIPATIASYQVAECIKLLTGKGKLLRNKMMYFDLLHNNNFIIDLND